MNNKGFLVIDTIIAGLILTVTIAAVMYLFRTGYDYIDRANESNLLSAKLPQAVNLIKALDLAKGKGDEDMGEGVSLRWAAQMARSAMPLTGLDVIRNFTTHEILLYEVDLSLNYHDNERAYSIYVLKYRDLYEPTDIHR